MRPFEHFRMFLLWWRNRFIPHSTLQVKAVARARRERASEHWDPIAGHISEDEWMEVMSFINHRCRTRDWRKMNLIQSYHPTPITPDQFRKEFSTMKAWTASRFEYINRQLRSGFQERQLTFRCKVIFKNGGYGLSKMVPSS